MTKKSNNRPLVPKERNQIYNEIIFGLMGMKVYKNEQITVWDLNDPELAIAYTKGGVTTYKDNETLIPSFTSATASAEFTLEQNKKGKPYIVVSWSPKECCPCGIHANTKYINIE